MKQAIVASFLRLITGARPRWTGCQPHPRQRVYFANHSSNLDGPTIWAVLPPELLRLTRVVAARDYWSAGRVRKYLANHIFNAIQIERKKPTRNDNPIEDMLQGMGENGSLILFPEGGRFLGTEPAQFKSGLFHLARKRPSLEFVPVLLENLNRILPKGEFLPVPLICSVTFGAPFTLNEGEGRDNFLARSRQAILELRPTEAAPAGLDPSP